MNPCPEPDVHPCIACGVERPHAALVRTGAGLRCRLPCIPATIARRDTLPTPVRPGARRPVSWIATAGDGVKLIVTLEDRPHEPREVAQLIGDFAAVAVGEATGHPVRPTVRPARYFVDPEP